MKCNEVKKHIRSIDKDPAAAQHIRECSSCAAYAQSVDRICTHLSSFKEIEPGPELDIKYEKAMASLTDADSMHEPLAKIYTHPVLIAFTSLTRSTAFKSAASFLIVLGVTLSVLTRPHTELLTVHALKGDIHAISHGKRHVLNVADELPRGTVSLVSSADGWCEFGKRGVFKLRLNENSMVTINKCISRKGKLDIKLSLKNGILLGTTEAAFKGSSLSLASRDTDIAIVGTTFMVYTWKGGTELRVLEGTVQLKDTRTGAITLVGSGHKAENLAASGPTGVQPIKYFEKKIFTTFVPVRFQNSRGLNQNGVPVESKPADTSDNFSFFN